jgi:hypothetical protein
MKGKQFVRSYIFDVPYGKYSNCKEANLKKPNTNKNHIKELNLRIITSATALSTEESLAETNENTEKANSNFPMKFLPYIYAQNGLRYVENILRPEKDLKSVNSLPLVRKESSIFLLEEKSKNLSSRMKSNEVLRG